MDKIDEAKRRKAINFDLSTSELRKIFGYCGTAMAYGLIKKFMLEHEFEHRQYSGYISKKPMAFITVLNLTNELTLEFPWLCEVVKRMDVTSVLEDTIDLIPALNEPYEKGNESVKTKSNVIITPTNEVVDKVEDIDALDEITEAIINESSMKKEHKEILFALIEDYKNNTANPKSYPNVDLKYLKNKDKNDKVQQNLKNKPTHSEYE
mgnify:CR=1 FL=1